MKHIISLFSALFLFVNTINGQLPSYVPTEGLIGFWSFTENANDNSGNNQNGTVVGAELTQDRFGNENSAYYFTSTNCETRIDVDLLNPVESDGLTVSYWVRRTGDGCIGPRVLEFYNASENQECQFQNIESKNYVGHILNNGALLILELDPIPSNIWIHIVYTHDSQAGRYYVNGDLVAETFVSGAPYIASDMAIGRMNHPAYDAHEGDLDDIGVWDRALSQAEITILYESEIILPNNEFTKRSTVIYPNPVSDQLQVLLGEKTFNTYLVVKDLNGQIILKENLKEESSTLNLSFLSKGLYFISINSKYGEEIHKIIKN